MNVSVAFRSSYFCCSCDCRVAKIADKCLYHVVDLIPVTVIGIIGGVLGSLYNYALHKVLRLYNLINDLYGCWFLASCMPCDPSMVNAECPTIGIMGYFKKFTNLESYQAGRRNHILSATPNGRLPYETDWPNIIVGTHPQLGDDSSPAILMKVGPLNNWARLGNRDGPSYIPRSGMSQGSTFYIDMSSRWSHQMLAMLHVLCYLDPYGQSCGCLVPHRHKFICRLL
ncbi:Chloride channel ClC-plant [Artemisia annua]|uniref:Chloride channel ClC-plant n=1 Tax=Artemisia annua TaxID=35608 RepID=A0A2U1NT10_ARTAN|nr:Chloride channel ClC-plant [Artemisia annua]